MTLEKLKFLIAASKKETEKSWHNRGGLEYTNELLEFLNSKVNFQKNGKPTQFTQTKLEKKVFLTLRSL